MEQKPITHFLSSWIGINKIADPDLNLQQLRQRTFISTLNTALVIGFAALCINLYTNFRDGDLLVALLSIIIYSMLLTTRFVIKERNYQLKVIIFLTVVTIEGLILSSTKTMVGDGRIFLLFGPLAAAIFLNVEAGFILLAINLVGWIGIGILFRTGLISYPSEHLVALIAEQNISLWINSAAVFSATIIVIITSVAILLNNLNQLLEQSQKLTRDLQDREKKHNQAKAALNSSEDRYRRLIDNSPDLIMEISKDHRILSLNPAMRHSLGLGDTPVEKIRLEKILGENVYRERLKILKTVLHHNRRLTFEDQREDRIFQNIFIPAKDGNSVQVIAHDVTNYKNIQEELLNHQERLEELVAERTTALRREILERERAEKAARAAQKMADIGLLTTGVAHELNSPLQAILSNAEVTLRQLERAGLSTTSLVRGKLHAIIADVLRSSKIVRSLQYYAHTSPKNREKADLINLVIDTQKNIEHEFVGRDEIQIETRFQKDLPLLSCDAGQLQRALINLLLNARDALPDGGKIIIRVEYQSQEEEFIIQVEDNGIGIPEDLQDQVFKPFVTTKKVGQGTGLGLYLVYGIVQAHGGEISFISESGIGTTFTIILPSNPPEIDVPAIKGRYGTSDR